MVDQHDEHRAGLDRRVDVDQPGARSGKGLGQRLGMRLDDPDACAPLVQIQCAERLGYMANLNEMPAFERWPGG